MATSEEEKNYRELLRKQLEQLKAIDSDSLVRADALGQALSFQAGIPYFHRALRLFRELAEINLDTFPGQKLAALMNVAEDANNQFSQI